MADMEEHAAKRRKLDVPTFSYVILLNKLHRLMKLRSPDTMVTFIVGPDATKFIVHKEFVCHYSPVLKAAFTNDHFIEGKTQTYTIKDTTTGAFRLLVQWFYTQSLTLQLARSYAEKKRLDEQHPEWRKDEWRVLAELWVLADLLALPRLQNLAIRKLLDHENDGEEKDGARLEILHYVYDNTATDSPLRQFCTEICFWLPTNAFVNEIEKFPKELLADFAEYTMGLIIDGNELPKTRTHEASSYFVPEVERRLGASRIVSTITQPILAAFSKLG